MIGELNIKVMGEAKKVSFGITYQELANEYKDMFKFPIVLAKIGYNYKELNEIVMNNEEIEFADLKDLLLNNLFYFCNIQLLLLLALYIL